MAVASMVAMSCNTFEPENPSKGRTVTISAGLPVETKVAHSLDGTTVKPSWETGDKVYVRFTSGGTDHLEEFSAVSISSDGKSATFSNPDSQLPEGTAYTVVYASPEYTTVSGNDLIFDLDGQAGTLSGLPEYLTAEVTDGSSTAVLQSQLTIFHFVLTLNNPSSYKSIEEIQFGACPNSSTAHVRGYFATTNTGTTAPAVDVAEDSFTPAATIDIYAAAFMLKQSSAYNVRLKIKPVGTSSGFPGAPGGHGSSEDQTSSSWYYCNWTTSKTYAAGKVYKVTGTLALYSGD